MYTRQLLHKGPCTQTPLHKAAVRHRSFYLRILRSLYTEQLSHTEVFPQRSLYTLKLLHRIAFTQRPFTDRHFYAKQILHTKPLNRETFTQSSPYTALHTEAFAHRRVYTQTLLHTEAQKLSHRTAFTQRHRSFYTEQLYTQKLLHTAAFPHRRFSTRKPLHRTAFTQRRFYTGEPLHRARLLHKTAFTQRPFRHRPFYTETPLHKAAFRDRSFYIRSLYTEQLFTHRSFYTERPLHTKKFYTDLERRFLRKAAAQCCRGVPAPRQSTEGDQVNGDKLIERSVMIEMNVIDVTVRS